MIYVKRGEEPKELDLTKKNSIGSAELAEATTYFKTQTRKFEFSAYKDVNVLEELKNVSWKVCVL
ncbi:hypothetical protein KQ3_04919 [Bacillus cereus B5-2]|nr:hypothetical protein KQ3_04919 [Bacillus cereus B5-2]